jgi:cardiolipin synthase (CMP-forming)
LWQRSKILIPNAMTAVRLLLIYPYVMFMVAGDRMSATLTFIIALITDVDGTVARSIGATSKFGALFDPIVDIIFAITATAVLVHYNSMQLWAVLVYFASVLVKFTYMQYYFRKNKKVKSSIVSKTVANSASIAIVLASAGTPLFVSTIFLLIGAIGNGWLAVYWWIHKRTTL